MSDTSIFAFGPKVHIVDSVTKEYCRHIKLTIERARELSDDLNRAIEDAIISKQGSKL